MRTIVCAIALYLLASPAALATQCPALWVQINEKMQVAHLSDADNAMLAELRQQGDTFHHAGQHDESIAALNRALALLDGASAS